MIVSMPAKQVQKSDTTDDTPSLVDVLVTQGSLTSQRGEQVKLAEVQSGKSQEDILCDQNMVSEEELTKAKAAYYNVPFVDLSSSPVNPDSLSALPKEVAERFLVFPLDVDRNLKILTIAMADPLDLTAIEFVEKKTGMRIKPLTAERAKIVDFISVRYATSLSQQVTAALKEVAPDDSRLKTLDLSVATGVIRQEKTTEIVIHIMEFPVKSRASDIHLEPQEKSTRVRYRIDGILQEKLTIPKALHDAIVSRIKILSGMKIDEKRIPQDGRFNFKTVDEEVDLRVSTVPTSWGEKIVLRLLKKSGGVPDLPQLGLRGRALKNLEDAVLRPHGIITICGPTGSGKTTTLYSIISKINTPKVNIMTLEDPVEYKIAGVNQIQINPSVGLTFASGLRAFLRQDPNVILVGEIRDQETADLAIQASLTGHLVFSTLHTNDAAGALPRLLDMHAEPFLLASSMTCIAAQRVLRRIDEKNKEEYIPEPKILDDMRLVLGSLFPESREIKLYRGRPTSENNNSGYMGRIAIFEVLPVSEKISRLILERKPASDVEAVAKRSE